MTERKFDRSEAQAMRKRGISYQVISDALGVTRSTVREALNGRGLPGSIDLRRRPMGVGPVLSAGPDCQFVKHHVYRKPRQLIDRAAIRRILDERRGGIPIDSLRVLIRMEAQP